jgi:RND family efflux transporter MFP subunit
MNTKIQNAKEYIMSNKIISAIILLVILVIGYNVFSGNSSKQEVYTIKKGSITQKVIVNGKTKAITDSNLAFEVNGTVRSASVAVGSRVVVGQTLVSLDQGVAYADLLKARANLESEKARLDELKRGTRPEEIAVAEVEVKNAVTKLDDAERNLYNKVVDVVNNSIDQFFSNPKTSNPQFNLVTNDMQVKNSINLGRLKVEAMISSWDDTKIDSYLPEITALVDNVASVVNSQTGTSGLSQATIDAYKASMSTARSSYVTAKETLNTAQSTLALANQNLALKKSGTAPEVVRAQEAKVLQNEASVASAEVQLGKMTLRSPQNGIVTKQDAKVGEIVTPGKVVVSVISDSDLEIESNVSEVSIGKVSVGNPVVITFDAFTGEVFSGAVSYIEPGETLVDGVVNYKITVAFSEKYPQIKSGLTSKLDIITGEKKDVLTVPEYALIKEDGKNFAMKQNGKEYSKVQIETGLRGQDGFVEVLSGLNEGDVVETVVGAE